MSDQNMHDANLKIELLKVSANFGRSFNSPALCKPVACAWSIPADALDDDEDEVGADGEIDAYGVFDKRESVVFPPEFQNQIERNWDKEFAHTYEDECRVGELPIEKRVSAIETPCVIARGSRPLSYTCWCCQTNAAADLQMPDEVFEVAYCTMGPAEAICCLKSMGTLLEERKYDEVITRAACCRQVKCMIAQSKLTRDNYEAWYYSVINSEKPRAQLMRGTERKDQGVKFSDNVLLLRWIAVQRPPPLTDAQIAALFHWVVVNSQFIQEREKRFIATAMSIAESATFGFKMSNWQSFVDRMASVPRNYVHQLILPHIMDTTRDTERWQSWGNRLLETAFPKAPDAAFMIMCLENWEGQGRPMVEGRPAHRIPVGASYKELFTVHGFRTALTRAVAENPTYHLFYASAPPSKSTVKMGKGQSRADTQQLLKLVSGSHRRCYTIANGVRGKKAAPTCGAVQADSGVHTEQRYNGVAEGLLLKGDEKKQAVSLFIDVHRAGNSVGHEKLQGAKADRTKSKACATIRTVQEYTPPKATPPHLTKRQKMSQVAVLHELKPPRRSTIPGI